MGTGMDSRAVRAWAAEAGIDCPQRGRIPIEVAAAYDDAHGIERIPPAQGRRLPLLPGFKGDCSLVVRTDFANDEAWREVMTATEAPTDEGFVASLEVCEDRAFTDLTPAELIEHLPNCHGHPVLFVIDVVTLQRPEHPLLAVDLRDEPGREFRLIPSYVQSLSDNLNVANMRFHQFADCADADGVLRSFP